MSRVEGGRKAAIKILARDPDHYRKIGAIGGRKGHTGGFAANRTLARLAGSLGGHRSKRKWTLEERIHHSKVMRKVYE